MSKGGHYINSSKCHGNVAFPASMPRVHPGTRAVCANEILTRPEQKSSQVELFVKIKASNELQLIIW